MKLTKIICLLEYYWPSDITVVMVEATKTLRYMIGSILKDQSTLHVKRFYVQVL